jgi:hypothetical protein
MSLDQIFTSVCLFQNGRPLSDDCTLVGLDYVGRIMSAQERAFEARAASE